MYSLKKYKQINIYIYIYILFNYGDRESTYSTTDTHLQTRTFQGQDKKARSDYSRVNGSGQKQQGSHWSFASVCLRNCFHQVEDWFFVPAVSVIFYMPCDPQPLTLKFKCPKP